MSGTKDLRLPALRRFAFAISLLTVLGHTVFGFEQSWAAPLVGIGTAYATEILLEAIVAWQQRRRPRFLGGGVSGAVDFLLSAHITGLAVSMLLYSGERLWPVVWSAAAAIASKYLFRVAAPGGGSRHFLNPSNFGITATLLLFPSVGIAQPYMFTEKLSPAGAWVLPAILVCAGSFLNARFTRKLPLIAGWVGAFGLQAMARWALFGNRPLGSLMPLTGVALLLFTFYMVTDPATTPVPARRQVAFGAAVASVYGVLLASHLVFTPFFALTVVSAGRGAALWVAALRARRAARAPLAAAGRPGPVLVPATATAAATATVLASPAVTYAAPRGQRPLPAASPYVAAETAEAMARQEPGAGMGAALPGSPGLPAVGGSGG